jgi:acyl carrier protein
VSLKQEITDRVLALLKQLANDWEYEGEISAETYLFSELGFQSLDVVILGNTLQEQYGQPIPYSELLADIGKRPLNDTNVGEWIEFTCRHLAERKIGAHDDL